MKKSLLLFSLFILFCGNVVSAQKKFSLKLHVPSGISPERLEIFYNTGNSRVVVKPVFNNNKLTIAGEFYTKYASVSINYYSSDREVLYGNDFWVTEKPAVITFPEVAVPAKDSSAYEQQLLVSLRHPALINAGDIGRMGDDQLNNFLAAARKEVAAYGAAHAEKIEDKDSEERKMYCEKLQAVESRKIQFVTENSQLYYSLWFFLNDLVYAGQTVPEGYKGVTVDSLTSLFNRIFPDDAKNSFEGKMIRKVLKGRALEKGAPAASFSALDLGGKKISLHTYKGKYVLLVFWATWCAPCIAELPAIKEIRSTYSTDELCIISVSLDTDIPKLKKYIKDNNMNWLQIGRDENLISTYGVSGIPSVWLIDKEGKIAYKDKEESADYNKLPVLKNILKEHLTAK
ncbi:TlpA family protein disulfide reductase [Chitinophaga flava]|uniref:Thioredoxin domain-containing protein n=1 Tax=Chitinophaga flava TaxID=2259036 RepID=A0A365XTL2_9BACT|nr:TlpA disulfide reductase family protein [Chitinophaga flava]RBL89458.1 hypothetical protein DF182_23370 [Chitinophaga flava]